MDVAAVRASFSRVARHGNEPVARYFYNELFTAHPDLSEMFPRNMTAQKDRLMKAITRIVKTLDDPDKLVPFLRELGRAHKRKYRVWPWHYEWVGAALIRTLAHFDPEWTEALQREWMAGYAFLAQQMKAGVADGDDGIPGAAEQSRRGNRESGVTADSMGVVRFPRVLFGGYRRRSVDGFLSLAWGTISQLEEDNHALIERNTELEEWVRTQQDMYRPGNSDLSHIPGEVAQERRDGRRHE
jgi:hemoglobin-like flavoprotein